MTHEPSLCEVKETVDCKNIIHDHADGLIQAAAVQQVLR